jgi:hypothetical protein
MAKNLAKIPTTRGPENSQAQKNKAVANLAIGKLAKYTQLSLTNSTMAICKPYY